MAEGFIHDQENNVLHIMKNKQEKQKLKGFIIHVVDSHEEAEQIKVGNFEKLKLAPVLANDENQALELINNQGQIPISVVNYEYLKFQVELLENLAKQTNVDLIIENNIKVDMQ